MKVSSTLCWPSILGCYGPGTCSHQCPVRCRLEMQEAITDALCHLLGAHWLSGFLAYRIPASAHYFVNWGHLCSPPRAPPNGRSSTGCMLQWAGGSWGGQGAPAAPELPVLGSCVLEVRAPGSPLPTLAVSGESPPAPLGQVGAEGVPGSP